MAANKEDFPENLKFNAEGEKVVAMAYAAACSKGFALRLVSINEAQFNIWRYWKFNKRFSKKIAVKMFYLLEDLPIGEHVHVGDYEFIKCGKECSPKKEVNHGDK